MGSLRNPIGPLPSSIYWRRRAVALGLLGLLVLLGLWFVTLGGDGGSGDDQSKGTDGKNPGDSTTITPGPEPSGPHYSQRPGGRGESGSGGSGSSGGDDRSGGGTGASGTGGAGTGGGGTTGTGGGGALGTGDGKAVPVGSPLPDCSPGAVRLAIRSVKDAYRPDEKPKFEVVVKNSGGSACKVNFGATAAILKITHIDGDDRVWASDDCPRATGPVLVELPGSGETKRTVEWDRKRSAPHCATPSGDGAAGTGKYRAEVRIAGVTEKVEFTLEKD
ncbi:hypothetical protein [Streptomyces roseoverticillatus]|uniref:DUF4232 domain-containing protein n=1 Tax=Streptomyces roseoverticillatus TaxID=66429 RepID=A0ABV3J2G8_9ACTN